MKLDKAPSFTAEDAQDSEGDDLFIAENWQNVVPLLKLKEKSLRRMTTVLLLASARRWLGGL